MSAVFVAGGGSSCKGLARSAGASPLKHLGFASLPASAASYTCANRWLSSQRDLIAAEAYRRSNQRRNSRSVHSSIKPNRNHCRSFSRSRTSHHQTPPSSSVSDSEVSHFSALASSWWDPHGPSRLLHLMNPLRHDFIRQSLALSSGSSFSSSSSSSCSSSPSRKLTYLDIGCGGGIFSSSAALLPSTESVTGIDPTAACIDVALAHARTDPALRPPSQGGKLRFLHTSIEGLASVQLDDGGASSSSSSCFAPVDIVTIFEVVEHVTSPASFLKCAATHLKPGGWLIGSTISRHPLSYVTTKLLGEAPIIGVVPRGTHDWNKYINPDELREHFETDSSQGGQWRWENFHVQGVIYVPGLGWKEVTGSENVGNYFFGVQKVQAN